MPVPRSKEALYGVVHLANLNLSIAGLPAFIACQSFNDNIPTVSSLMEHAIQ
jgi:hypothetical protein